MSRFLIVLGVVFIPLGTSILIGVVPRLIFWPTDHKPARRVCPIPMLSRN